jgi:hypothetical protein
MSNSGELDSTLGRTAQRSYTREAKLGTVLATGNHLVWSKESKFSQISSSAICRWEVSHDPIWTFQWQAFLFVFLFTCARSFKAIKRLRTMKWIATVPKVLIQRSGACQILSICRFLWDLWHLWLGQHRSLALEVERVCAFAKELPDGPGLMDSFAWSVFMKTFIRFGDTVIDGDRVEFYGILPF